MTLPPVWLVDSSIYIFRAWYTWPDELLDRDGQSVNAVLGFLDFVRGLIEQQQPAQIAFAFDTSLQNSWRNSLYPPYKANRDPAPENLKYQFALCRRFIRALAIDEFASQYYEADDIIGTLASEARTQGQRVNLITADKDLMQLLRPGDCWWEYARDKRLQYEDVKDAIGVRPEQVADLLALAGDKVDNIPGVPGIGAVTAAKLLRRYGSLQHLLANADQIGHSKLRGAQRIQGLVLTHRQEIQLYRRITEIQCDIADQCLRVEDRPATDDDLLELADLLQMSDAALERWVSIRQQRLAY